MNTCITVEIGGMRHPQVISGKNDSLGHLCTFFGAISRACSDVFQATTNWNTYSAKQNKLACVY